MLQVSFSPVALCGIATYISANLREIFAKLQQDGKITEEGNCIGKANQRKIQQYSTWKVAGFLLVWKILLKNLHGTYKPVMLDIQSLTTTPRKTLLWQTFLEGWKKNTIGIAALHLGTWKSWCISCSSVMECRMSACSVTLLWSAVLFDCLSTTTCCSRRLVFLSSTSHLWFKVNRQRLLWCIWSWYS